MKRFIVILGVAGVSLSALFVRWSTAPSLILALYRMFFAAALLAPAVLARWPEFTASVRRRELLLSLLSGAFLGLHFTCYFEALNRTSIASAVVLVDTEALFVALASVALFRKKLSIPAWLAVLLAFSGSGLVALSDGGVGALQGDLIALFGAVCVSVYTLLGAVCRERLDTTAYTFLVYCSASGTLLLAAFISGTPVLGYGGGNLLTGLGLAVFCTLLGHSVFSWGLKYLPASFISTVKLLEPVFSSIYGFFLFGEQPGILTLLGGGMVLAGIALYSREVEA